MPTLIHITGHSNSTSYSILVLLIYGWLARHLNAPTPPAKIQPKAGPPGPTEHLLPNVDGDGPPPPPGDSEEQKEVGSVEPDEPEYDPDEMNDSDEVEFPISHEIVLKDHTKVISALSVDPSGARIVSGSHDYDCKLWDFGGMDHRCLPFHTWEPAGSYHVCFTFPFLSHWDILTKAPDS